MTNPILYPANIETREQRKARAWNQYSIEEIEAARAEYDAQISEDHKRHIAAWGVLADLTAPSPETVAKFDEARANNAVAELIEGVFDDARADRIATQRMQGGV